MHNTKAIDQPDQAFTSPAIEGNPEPGLNPDNQDATYTYVRRIMHAINKMDGVYYLFARNIILMKIPWSFSMHLMMVNPIRKRKLATNG